MESLFIKNDKLRMARNMLPFSCCKDSKIFPYKQDILVKSIYFYLTILLIKVIVSACKSDG